MSHSTVIVGASVAGVNTARSLRSAGYSGQITLLGEEAALPYDKPPLSKGMLAGNQSASDISLLSEAQAHELRIDLRLGHPATALNIAEQEVEMANGARISYDDVVIATGARARPSPWGHPDGLHLVRTLVDSQRLRRDLEQGGRLVVIGGGFIGAEVAASARGLGLPVTIVEPERLPMQRALGHELGERFLRLHQKHGVETFFGVGVEEICGRRGAFRIGLTDGKELHGDHIVVGIGAIPNDQWLASSGLDIDNGVVCDQYSRAFGTSHVHAVGDVARWQNPIRKQLTRVEHWTNAIEQAAVVAHNITHPDDLKAHSPVEYVWSDQYDWKIRIAGTAGPAEFRQLEIVESEPDSERFVGLFSADGGQTLTGLVVVNWPRALVAGRRTLDRNTPYSDFKQELEKLASAAQPRSEAGVGQ